MGETQLPLEQAPQEDAITRAGRTSDIAVCIHECPRERSIGGKAHHGASRVARARPSKPWRQDQPRIGDTPPPPRERNTTNGHCARDTLSPSLKREALAALLTIIRPAPNVLDKAWKVVIDGTETVCTSGDPPSQSCPSEHVRDIQDGVGGVRPTALTQYHGTNASF